MSTVQSLAAGAATAALLSALPLGWQTWQLSSQRAATAAASRSAPASLTNASSMAEKGKNPTARPAGARIVPANPPPEDAMEELGEALESEATKIMRHWAMSVAWTESRSIAMVLGLGPEREGALRSALAEFRESRVTATMEGGSQAGKERRKYQEQRDAWLSEHLSPEELTKVKAYDAAQREALIAAKAEEALHWISSKVDLSEEQKTRLFNAGAARTAADLDKDEFGGSAQFTGTFQSAPPPPVEEAARELVAGVLDAAQLQLWEESADRSKFATEEMPRQLVDRAFEMIRQRGLLPAVAGMMTQMLPPSDAQPQSDNPK